jgi:hypothetical protein
MQSRMNDVSINDVPKFLLKNPSPDDHAFVVSDPDDPSKTLTLPLMLRGVTSYLPTDTVTMEEYESGKYPRIELTSEHQVWEPSSTRFQEQEEAITGLDGNIIDRGSAARGLFTTNAVTTLFINSVTTIVVDAADFTSDDNFAIVLESYVYGEADAAAYVAEANVKYTGKKPVDPAALAKRWGIAFDRAEKTVRRTSQDAVWRYTGTGMHYRKPTNDRYLRYNRLPYDMYSDTLQAGVKSLQGNQYAQLFSTDFGWVRIYPMRKKSEAHETLSIFLKKEGVPLNFIMDNSKEQVLGNFAKKVREAGSHIKRIEPYTPWTNSAESEVREAKRGSSRAMVRQGAPKKLWDHSIELQALIRSHTAHDIFMLDGQVPEALVKGWADISNICTLEFYQFVMFHDGPHTYPADNLELGRWLGPTRDIGSEHTAKILKANAEVVHRSTFRPLNEEELMSESHTEMRKRYDEEIERRLGPAAVDADFPEEAITPEWEFYEDPDQPMIEGSNDNYVGVDIMLPRGGEMARGRVVRRKRDREGNTIGRQHNNPILDTRLYEVAWDEEGDDTTEMTANVIAESMYAQCDKDGNQYVLLDTFVDYRFNDAALKVEDQFKVDRSGKRSYRRSTAGVQLCCQWKDGSTSWEKLSDLKGSHPLETARYAKAQGLLDRAAFNWWAPQVLKTEKHIISQVKKRQARYLKRTHKFGVEIPRDAAHAKQLDEANGNTYWQDAIAKEMEKVRVAFRILPDGENAPIGYQYIRCHMIFDVKMENFQRKARFVAGGHMTKAPDVITYASVVSRETVRLALLLASLNDLEVKVGDIENAYLTAPVTEKIWTTLGPEFGADAGKKAVVVRALYGLKSAGAAFRKHLATLMRSMDYKPCRADPDLWMKPMVRPSDGFEYYAYILCYVDDIMVIHHAADGVLERINKSFKLKPGSVGDPNIYLGAKIKRAVLENGTVAWGMSSSKYVQEAYHTSKRFLEKNFNGKYSLPKVAVNPFPVACDPETDVSEPLPPNEASYYNTIIGVLRWAVELGRIDVNTEVSLLSSHLAYPREGHLEAALHVLSFLGQKHNARLIFDPTPPTIHHNRFPDHEWTEFYGDVKEPIPHDMPKPRGNEVDIRAYVDSDHAGDKVTRRSRTGFFIYVNNALIDWLSKKQPTIETSVFGAEFVAMKHVVEKLRGLRYKLRMMGVPISGCSYIYGDNMSVINNTQRPESTLKKKHNEVCYHFVRESVAMGESKTAHVDTHNNLADLMTKVLYGGKRQRLVSRILYDIYDFV